MSVGTFPPQRQGPAPPAGARWEMQVTGSAGLQPGGVGVYALPDNPGPRRRDRRTLCRKNAMPTCLITGITGQDGAYLSQFMLQKGYRVVGMMRRSASSDVVGERLDWLGIRDHVELVDGNLIDLSSLIRIVQDVRAGRGLQSRRAELRRRVLAAAAADRRGHRTRRRQPPGGGAHRAPGCALLPGLVLGDVRADPGAAPERNHAVPPALAICRGQALCPLDDGEPPREFRHCTPPPGSCSITRARCAASSS